MVTYMVYQLSFAGKKLLVLDLDHTLLHFSNDPKVSAEAMKRPYMQTFMATVREQRRVWCV